MAGQPMQTAASPPFAHNDSEFAAQLTSGFRGLRFEPGLERDYRAYHAAYGLLRVRTLALVAAAFLGLSVAGEVFFARAAPLPSFWLQVGVIAPILVLGLAASLCPPGKHYPAFVATLMLSAIAATMILLPIFWQDDIMYQRYEMLVLLTMAIYFLAGLRFQQALLLGAAILCGFVICHTLNGTPLQQWLQGVFYLTAANLLGLIGAYAFEYLMRLGYLNTELLRTQAHIDGLTGLHNRHHLDTELPRLWEQARRDRSPIAAAVFDVDYFKDYNDALGHLAGDDCLRRIAETLRAEARRPLDLAVRYGGEEFLVVWFENASERHLHNMLERVRQNVEAKAIPHPASPIGEVVTVSGGGSVMVPRKGMEAADFLGQADHALYRAKRRGRNCTWVVGKCSSCPPHKPIKFPLTKSEELKESGGIASDPGNV